MKKIMFLLILSALLLLAGCGREKLPAEKAATPVQAQNVAYSETAAPAAVSEEAPKDGAIEGEPLENVPTEREPGALPDPEPVEPTVETQEK